MRVLGIETSCDDTSIAIVSLVKKRFQIEVNVTASQVLMHRQYGGVVPEVAAREHAVTILPTLKAALQKSKRSWRDIDAIAVTGGPGLNTALLVGVETARTLGYVLKKPIVRVNHIEGHVVSNWAGKNISDIKFPAVALIVSGGHTELILLKKFGQYRLLGKTRDDAVGEAFDKVAKLFGLSYPGGPAVSKCATSGNPKTYNFPRSMFSRGSLEFSYAGLKTAVLYKKQELGRLNKQIMNDLCASFQAAAVDQLVEKSKRALALTSAKTFLLGGGVAANSLLRQQLATMITKNFPSVECHQPVLSLCPDNAAMIAIAGIFHARHKDFTLWPKLKADPNWELV